MKFYNVFNCRIMYRTRSSIGSIHKAGMDGTDPLTLVTGLNVPAGVTIDFGSRRLYWTQEYGHIITVQKAQFWGLLCFSEFG